MYGDCFGEVGVLRGSTGVNCVWCAIKVAFLPSQPEAGFRRAITNDFCCCGKGSRCSNESHVVPVEKGGSESRDGLYFFMDVVHEKSKEGVG